MLEIKISSEKELPEQQGFTHLAEHMLFFGNIKHDYENFYNKKYELFGKLEAITNSSCVKIYAQFDKNKLEEVKDFLINMIYTSNLEEKNFTFLKEEMEQEIYEYNQSRNFDHKKRVQKYIPKLHSLVGNWKKGELSYDDCRRAQNYWNELVQKSSIENYFIGDWKDEWMKDFQNIFKNQNNELKIKESSLQIIKTSKKELIFEYSNNYKLKQDLLLFWFEDMAYKNKMEYLIFSRENKEYFSIISDSTINLDLFVYENFIQDFDYMKEIYLSELGMDIDIINYKSTFNRVYIYNKLTDTKDSTLEKVYKEIHNLKIEDYKEYFPFFK